MSVKQSWYKITASKHNDDEAEIDIFGHIGAFDVSAKDFIREFRDLDAKRITININSGGGDVFEGMAILETIAQSDAHTTAKIIGLAASMGSAIAMAADVVKMTENSSFMIHNATAFAMGDAEEMRRTADRVDKLNDTLAAIYATKSGIDVSEIKDMMTAETWLSASEAEEKGFVDEVEESMNIAATVDLKEYAKVYSNIPKNLFKTKKHNTMKLSEIKNAIVDGFKEIVKANATDAEKKATTEAIEAKADEILAALKTEFSTDMTTSADKVTQLEATAATTAGEIEAKDTEIKDLKKQLEDAGVKINAGNGDDNDDDKPEEKEIPFFAKMAQVVKSKYQLQ